MARIESKTDKVLLAEHQAGGGKVIAVATLNKPKALNALDLDMAEALLDALRHWQTRDDIACVVLNAEGEKAFCAGGDIVSMFNAMKESQTGIPDFLTDFFACEYTLDYTIHTYQKPIVVWGSGIVMGGGMGLFTGASHRVVTPTSRLAMPEITIGLYPDVGGSYFLPRLPGHTGLFLGLTGANINAADALYLGWADFVAADDAKTALIDALVAHEWEVITDVAEQVSEVISGLAQPALLPQGQVEAVREAIDTACEGESLSQICQQIQAMDAAGNTWLERAKATAAKGSPITAHLVYQQCLRGKGMSLLGCFEMELIMSCRCGEFGEFQEGVRALLIDKDNAPQWRYPNVESVPDDVITTFFTSPWDVHPLAELEKLA
ncbi:enoyl-CoA hydratase/isomerase family protein [Alteromonas sp. CYL-A6]|uniref:enoyl-CoA hydratase/isomerase family protein n=1 Tax=Alteromonas nitratireducens TaxID=3390813 RepID=UPI0034B2C8D3